MPAVAQISVNFASRFNIISNSTTLPTSVRSVTPLALTQYLLENREIGSTALTNPSYINYSGGFITAGNKVNVKHDSDLQLRQNLDIEQSAYVDTIYARRKGNTADTYQSNRLDTSRSINIAPFTTDITNTNSSNYFNISTTSISKSISLFINHGTGLSDKENSITLFNDNSLKRMNLKTGNYVLSANDIKNFGPIYNSSTVEIEGQTTITDNLRVTGDLSLGTTSYNKFNVTSSNGNVAFIGNLAINTNKFTVASSTGNTVIAGTITINGTGDNTIKGTVTISNSITFDTGATTASTRRIIGIRQVTDAADIFTTSTYLTDPLSIGDFKNYYQSSNVGTGEGSVFKQRNSLGVMEFKRLKAGTNISIVDDGNSITINNSSPLGLTVIGKNSSGDDLTDAQIRNIVQSVFPAASFSNGTICRVNVEYPSNANISGVSVSVPFTGSVRNNIGRSIGRSFLASVDWTGSATGNLAGTGSVNSQPTFRVSSRSTKIFTITGGSWTYTSG